MSSLTSGRPRVLKRRKNPSRPEKLTVGQYLLKRLAELGLAHLHVVPGANLECFEELIDRHPRINLVLNSSLKVAAEMADGYGKAKGLACLATQETGGEMLDTLMRASSESVPLVVILGTKEELPDEATLYSSFEDGMSYLEKVFRQFTSAWTELSDPKLAPKKIDRVLDYCLFLKKPVCIELPQEVVDLYIPQHYYTSSDFEPSDPDALEEALLDCATLLNRSKHPILYLGREVLAQKAEPLALYFAERWHLPIASSYLAKKFLLETHPNYIGDLTPSLIGRSDLLLAIGANEQLPAHIQISSTHVNIKQRTFPNIYLKEMIVALCSHDPEKARRLWYSRQRNVHARDDLIIVTTEPSHLAKMSHFLSGDAISSAIHSPQYSINAAMAITQAQPHRFPIVILKESELRASLTELYSVYEQGLKMVICVEGSAHWLKPLFPEIALLRRKLPHLPTDDLVIVSLE